MVVIAITTKNLFVVLMEKHTEITVLQNVIILMLNILEFVLENVLNVIILFMILFVVKIKDGIKMNVLPNVII